MENYVNVAEGLGRLRDNKVIYKTLLKSFFNNNYMGELANSLEEKDFERATRAAHSIKGVCANLSMPIAREAALALESQLKLGFGFEQPYEDLKIVMEKTMEQIGTLLETL